MKGPRRSEMLEKYGHAGGHLRDALLESLEQYGDEWWEHVEIDFYRERDNRWWNQLSARAQARWLLGQLWHCTDILPGDVRSVFEEDHEVFTYAQLARLLAQDLKPIKDAA